MSDPVLSTHDLRRSFRQGGVTIDVLRGVELTIRPGEIVALLGPSGSGKSTLLQAVGLLEGGFQGSIRIAGNEASQLDGDARTKLRAETLGFVYQFHHLLPEFSAVENIVLPQLAHGIAQDRAEARARDLLGRVGLDHRLDHRPGTLSGGEQQRVAFCRALANAPRLLLADEPTGNLDPETSDTVFDTLMGLVRETGMAALIATHNPGLAARMDRRLKLSGGVLVSS